MCWLVLWMPLLAAGHAAGTFSRYEHSTMDNYYHNHNHGIGLVAQHAMSKVFRENKQQPWLTCRAWQRNSSNNLLLRCPVLQTHLAFGLRPKNNPLGPGPSRDKGPGPRGLFLGPGGYFWTQRVIFGTKMVISRNIFVWYQNFWKYRKITLWVQK